MIEGYTIEQEKKLRTAFIQTFGTVAGQVVIKFLEATCFRYKTTVVAGDKDATLVNEGSRRTLLTIEELMSQEGIETLAKPAEKE